MASSISNKYEKLSQIEHVLKRPNVYVSSINSEPQEIYVYDDSSKKIVKKTIEYNPALSKIYDEILVNAFDHVFRTRNSDNPVKRIDIEFDQVKNRISVKNDGKGIECIKHEKYGMYIPQMLFGELNSSSNYNDDIDRFVSGVNGMGSKLTVIFSKYFNVETVGIGDDGKQKKFSMTIKDNMKIKQEPKLTDYSKTPYTKITFEPDLKRFNMEKLTDDMVSFMIKRCYDIAASCFDEDNKRVSVYVNKQKLNIKTFKDYIHMYVSKDTPLFYEKISDNFFVGVVLNGDDNFEQVSFVNGSYTRDGGSHVNYITKKLIEHVDVIFKKKKIDAKSSFIKNKMFVFVNSFINRPEFSGQIKEVLTTPSKNFSEGGKLNFSKQFVNKFVKSGIVSDVESLIKYKNQKELSKTDGKKKQRIKAKDAFDDAIKAGTKESHKCKLIITEGNSALNFASNGISVIGREYYGTYPLRGKILNVKNASYDKIGKNEEIRMLKEILGLKHGHKYTSLSELRYGGLVVLTDSDVDGYHIKGLVINFIETFWPELINLGFVFSLATPIVKARKNNKCIKFYTLKEYEEWKKINNNSGWKIKYYKGLGTSDDYEAKESFEDFENKMVCYTNEKKSATDCINLAFHKDNAQKRKDWLLKFDHNDIITQMSGKIEVEDFVHKELKHFSYDDIRRSIPSIVDGMKPTQRKILYAALKKFKNTKNESKLIEFIGYVMSETLYHHGDASIASTSIGMADDYVGSNNVNLLKPLGQYNSRQRSNDAAAPRYLNTQMADIATKIFHEEDNKILNYLDEDGTQIEPEFYVPCIPYILVNGSVGIGTGFSTTVLPHDVEDLVKYIKDKLDGKAPQKLIPKVRQYRGTIKETEPKKYISEGYFSTCDDNNTVLVTELPYGMFVENYKNYLEKSCYDKSADKKTQRSQFIEYYNNYSTKIKVKFELFFTKAEYEKFKKKSHDDQMKILKLTSNMSETNMYLFDKDNQIRKFKTAEEIMDYWYDIRLDFYSQRKQNMIDVFEREVSIIKNRVRFIRGVRAKKIDVMDKKATIEATLEKMKFDKLDGAYDYLIDMKIRSLTDEKANELEELLKKKLMELEALKNKTIRSMWVEDLKEILDENRKYNEKLNEKFEKETIKHTKGKKITKARKTTTKAKKAVKKAPKKSTKKTLEL